MIASTWQGSSCIGLLSIMRPSTIRPGSSTDLARQSEGIKHSTQCQLANEKDDLGVKTNLQHSLDSSRVRSGERYIKPLFLGLSSSPFFLPHFPDKNLWKPSYRSTPLPLSKVFIRTHQHLHSLRLSNKPTPQCVPQALHPLSSSLWRQVSTTLSFPIHLSTVFVPQQAASTTLHLPPLTNISPSPQPPLSSRLPFPTSAAKNSLASPSPPVALKSATAKAASIVPRAHPPLFHMSRLRRSRNARKTSSPAQSTAMHRVFATSQGPDATFPAMTN